MARRIARNDPASPADTLSTGDIAVRIARAVARLDPGPAAALRRGPLAGAGAAAFWKLMADHDIPAKRTEAWATVVHATAILTPVGRAVGDDTAASAHDASLSMGGALYGAGLSELRLARLLGAKGRVRGDQLVRLCRRLARDAEHRRFDVGTLARFVVRGDEDTDRRIARDYYRAESRARAAQPQTKEQELDA